MSGYKIHSNKPARLTGHLSLYTRNNTERGVANRFCHQYKSQDLVEANHRSSSLNCTEADPKQRARHQ